MKKRGNRSKADVNPLSDSTVSPQASLAQSGQDLRRKAEAFAREQTAHTPADLRKQAEARLALSPEPLAATSPAETQRLLHELQVHQIELEMQNDELRKAQAEIEAGRARYFDLYDLAPVGYVTVGEKGLVLEANLTAASLLGVNRDALVRQPLTRFMLKEDQDLYYLLRKRLTDGSGGQAPSLPTCELRMVKPDGSFFWAQLAATATEGPDGAPACRVVLSDSTERKRAEAALQEIRDLLDATQRLTKVGGWEWDVTRQKMTWTDETYRIHDFDPAAVPAGSPTHIERSLACYDGEGRKRVADAFRRCIEEGEDYDVECGFTSAAGRSLRVRTIGRAIRENGHTVKVMGNLQDLTELRKAEESLKRIEWMLSKNPTPDGAGLGEDHDQGYGDLTELNRDGVILKSVGLERLQGLAEDYLDLLGTSSAIYEANGAYAYGLFSSGWCRMMDCASRNPCATSNNVAALNSGRWLCHESCWTDCCKQVVANGAPVDIACHGGIRMYAVPIMAHGNVVGAMNFGYGDPPKTPEKLRMLAETYQLDYDDLVRAAHAYDSRPPFIIELAKKRLHATARLIGAMIETKQSEEALRESEERLRLAHKATNDVVWDWDIVHDAQRWNDAGTAVFGLTDIVERPQTADWWVERVHPDDRQRVHESFFAVVENPAENFWHDEYRFRKADGSYADVLDRGYVLRNPQGKAVRMIGAMLDISERKRAEAAHAKLQEQFTQAQKMEAVGRLAGGVAHDFNNLLMGIMGYTQLCRDKIAPDHPIREWLDEIINDSNRSAEITRQLLAFARKQTIEPRVLDLNNAVAGMLKLLRRMIGEDIKLIWRPGVHMRPVKLDPSQIDQILANLCVNARDAIAGVGEITLETGSTVIDAEYCAVHPEAIPGAYAFLAVSDNGCGMDQETLAQVFEPFFTTKGVGKGTGLGLATVYGIVKQNSGFIYAYSEPGKGTTFKIYLPELAAETVATNVTNKTESPQGRGETVLLVEDEKSLRVTCRLFLEGLGYKVLVAETPGAALKVMERHSGDIDVLLTDVVMPEMDGGQLAKCIGAVKPGIKVLFMSGYTADVIAQRGVLNEGVQFIPKPFTRDDLARKMCEILEGPRSG